MKVVVALGDLGAGQLLAFSFSVIISVDEQVSQPAVILDLLTILSLSI